MEKRLAIAHFTDPLCFWCYAMEPEIRKVRVLLDDVLDYRIVMGVLTTDVREIVGFDPESEVRYELMHDQITEHIANAAKKIGMPIAIDRMADRKPEEFVSLPLSLAYCAMRAIDEGMAEAYLRRMRECVYAEGRGFPDTESLVELASEFPVDLEQFRNYYEGGVAAGVLQDGINACWANSVAVFPTLLMEYDGKRYALRGYFDYDAMKKAIAQLTEGEINLTDAEYSLGALEAYVDRFGKVAAREVQTMFSLNDAQLANVMMDLVSTGGYKTEKCGTSYFITAK